MGSNVTVTVTGMLASHSVTATFNGGSVSLSASTTNSTGGLTATFTVPASVSGGQIVQLSDGANSPTATYTVAAIITLTPMSGTNSTTVTVAGSGFATNSAITIMYNGNTVVTTTATSSGAIPSGVTFSPPTGTNGTYYTVTATDASGNSASAQFEYT